MTLGADLMTASGLRLRLGKSIGEGGEGQIFQLENDRSFAVKLYTDGKADIRRDKVNAMIADKLFERTPFVAFPIEAVNELCAKVGDGVMGQAAAAWG
ncbi:MAG: hypothetical protein ACKVON_17405 [Beijerinckiaceae bacterium]